MSRRSETQQPTNPELYRAACDLADDGTLAVYGSDGVEWLARLRRQVAAWGWEA